MPPNKKEKDDSFKPTAEQIDTVYNAAHDNQVNLLKICQELGVEPGGGRIRTLIAAVKEKYPDFKPKRRNRVTDDLTVNNLQSCHTIGQVDKLIVLINSFMAKAQDRKKRLSEKES